MTQILIQQTDSAGNIGYVLLDSTQTFTDSVTALAYLNTLPSGSYIAQITDGNTATILAQVP